MRRAVIILLLITAAFSPRGNRARGQIDPGFMSTVIVTFKDQVGPGELNILSGLPNRQERVIRVLESKAAESQVELKAWLESQRKAGQVGEVVSFWIFNGLAVTARQDVIENLASRREVASIVPNAIIPAPVSLYTQSLPEDNIALINAPALWSLGFQGQNVVVANMDTGVDVSHPDLSAQWRGGTNSWYDPHGEHPATPVDLNGHGTWTMGVMVGRDHGGTAIGVAPGAKWIAVKIFDDHNRTSIAAIHWGFQWLLDPDGDPETRDAPQVVNNSWDLISPGCNLAFQSDIDALRAAGILPIFSAGNYGPNDSTSVSPANNPGAFSVGAVNNQDQILTFSSRGPTSCGGGTRTYPALVAPGENIRTTDRFQFYTSQSGTSLASPQVAGGLALLISSYPGLPLVYQENALLHGVLDLGDVGPDNDFGSGRLDLLASYQWLVANYQPPDHNIYFPLCYYMP
jgi:subtilisin family serine protease